MAVFSEHAAEIIDDRLAARNALVLAGAQALAGAGNIVVVATGGIAGAVLAPDPALATLPVSLWAVGIWIGTLPVGLLAKYYGRRFALQAGSACGVIGGIVSSLAMLRGSFALLLLGAVFAGLYTTTHQAYRFAAADTASAQFRPKAVAWVLAGGVFSAFIGPQLIIGTKAVWTAYLFAGTYLAQAACAAIVAVVLSLLKLPRPALAAPLGEGRPLLQIAREPQFIVAVACGLVSYVMMNLMMTAAPLAMVMCHHSVGDAAIGIQWHTVGMYAPSFVTGALIARFGLRTIAALGLALMTIAGAIGLLGTSLWHFWTALAALGVGWNFAFIGATALVTQCHGPRERNKVQAFNDFLVFGAMAIGSFSSGAMLARFGWAGVNEAVFPVVAAAAALLVWGSLTRRPTPA